MSEIVNSITELKNKLFSLEATYETKLKNLEKREKVRAEIRLKFNEILANQDSQITFNISGKKISTSKALIVNSIYSNILKDLLSNLEKIGRTTEETHKIFIDRSPEAFKYIIEILWKSNEAYLKAGLDTSLISDLDLSIDPQIISIEAFKEEIKFYFKEDYEKVFEHFKFNFSGRNIVFQANQSMVSSVKVSSEFPSDQLNSYRAKSFEDISRISSKKAYFLSYDSTITFELSETQEIGCIEIRPFILDLNYWVPCEGANAFVFGSLTENGEFDFLGSLPEDYGLEFESHKKVYYVYFDKRNLKYIRIQTGDFTLSIAYIKFS